MTKLFSLIKSQFDVSSLLERRDGPTFFYFHTGKNTDEPSSFEKDWYRIGSDFRKAIGTYEKKHLTNEQKEAFTK